VLSNAKHKFDRAFVHEHGRGSERDDIAISARGYVLPERLRGPAKLYAQVE